LYLNTNYKYIKMKIKMCPYCANQIYCDEEPEHTACEDFYLFMLDEMITKARKKLEFLLLQRKELIIFKSNNLN
jgi:hypothetical protein